MKKNKSAGRKASRRKKVENRILRAAGDLKHLVRRKQKARLKHR